LGAYKILISATLAMIGEERLALLEGFPERYDGEGFSLVSCQPGDCGVLTLAPMRADEEIAEYVCAAWLAIAVYGHNSPSLLRPGWRNDRWRTAGSVSQSYDGNRTGFVFGDRGREDHHSRVEYDVERRSERAVTSGIAAAEWMSRILLAGQYVPPE